MPIILANSTAARNFTTLSYTNVTQIKLLKKEIALQPFIINAINTIELPEPITEINDDFRKLLFAHWITNADDFLPLKKQYKDIVATTTAASSSATTTTKNSNKNSHMMLINPTNISAVNETIGAGLSTVFINGTYVNVIIPESIRMALYHDWQETPKIIFLLGAFGKDMEISTIMTNANGTRYIIQPPPPPKKGKVANGYEYKSFGMFCLFFFCLTLLLLLLFPFFPIVFLYIVGVFFGFLLYICIFRRNIKFNFSIGT